MQIEITYRTIVKHQTYAMEARVDGYPVEIGVVQKTTRRSGRLATEWYVFKSTHRLFQDISGDRRTTMKAMKEYLALKVADSELAVQRVDLSKELYQ